MLWFRVRTSDKWIYHTGRLCGGLRLFTAAVAAAWAAVATVTTAWATTLMAATTTARLTAMTAAARLATVAATVMATVTAAAFLGSFSFSSHLHLTTVCLWHHRCNG